MNPLLFRLLPALLLPLLLTGCWDRVEIQDRLFVMAVAIDKAKPDKGKRNRIKESETITSLQPNSPKRGPCPEKSAIPIYRQCGTLPPEAHPFLNASA